MKKFLMKAALLAVSMTINPLVHANMGCECLGNPDVKATTSWTRLHSKISFDSLSIADVDANGNAAVFSLEAKRQDADQLYYNVGGSFGVGGQDYTQGSISDDLDYTAGSAFLNVGYTFGLCENLLVSPFAGYQWSYAERVLNVSSEPMFETVQNMINIGIDTSYKINDTMSTGLIVGATSAFKSQLRYTTASNGRMDADLKCDGLSYYASLPFTWEFGDSWNISASVGVESLHQSIENNNLLNGTYRETNYMFDVALGWNF